MERSRFLHTIGGAGAGVAASTLFGTAANAATPLLLTGISSSPSGSQQDNERGWTFALQQMNNTIDGHPVKLITRDDQAKPDVGVQQVTDAYEHDNARFFMGVGISSVALAIGQIVKDRKAVFITSTGADEITGKDCNLYMFRWVVPTYDAVRSTLYPFLKREPQIKTIYTLTPNYSFGESMLQNVKEVAAEHGLTLIGNDYHPLNAPDFSSYIAKIAAAKPDALITLNLTSDAVKTLKTATSFGLKKNMKIVWPWSAGLTDFVGVGADDLDGVYVGCQYYHDASPVTRKFSNAFKAVYGLPMSYFNASAYSAARIIAAAVTKAKSTDPTLVARAIEALKYDGVTGPEEIRAFDNQAIKKYYAGIGKPKSAMKDQWDFIDVIGESSNPIPRSRSLCRIS